MSETVSNALTSTKDKNLEETAKFIQMTDKFFDSLNVTALGNGKAKRKSFQSPYTNSDDFRLKVLACIHSYNYFIPQVTICIIINIVNHMLTLLIHIYPWIAQFIFLCSGSLMSLSHI